LPGSGKIATTNQPANLAGGVATETPSFVALPLAGGSTNKLVISAVNPGKDNDGVAVRFVRADVGEAASVEFRPLEGARGTLVFVIAANAQADAIRDLLNNHLVLKHQFKAEIKDAALALVVPD